MREQLLYRLNQRLLIWGEEEYQAVSGPYGKGALPPGFYTIEVRHVIDSQLLRESFRHADSGVAFFIPITPRFNTERSGFGIHPDGGQVGTRGCVAFRGQTRRGSGLAGWQCHWRSDQGFLR